MKSLKAPHCGALWVGCGRLRLRPFILCFNRTAISIQKIDSKSSKSHLKLFSRISSKSYRHNAVSNRFLSRFSTSLTNAPRLLSQAKWVHTRLSEKDRTQGHTRRNRGRFGWGGITTLGAFRTVRKPCVAGCQNGKLCRLWVLAGGAPEEHRKPSEQRCAYARRCPAGVAAPPGCVIFFCFCQNCGLHTMCSVLSACARRGVVSPLLVCSACCRNSRPPLVKTTNLPFSEVGWASLIPAAQKQQFTANSPGSL